MPFINFNNEENKIVQISVNNGPFVPNTLDNAYSFLILVPLLKTVVSK